MVLCEKGKDCVMLLVRYYAALGMSGFEKRRGFWLILQKRYLLRRAHCAPIEHGRRGPEVCLGGAGKQAIAAYTSWPR